jgi:hypothetical protein
MNIRDIPVRVIGPGSQPGDGDAITYMDMPNDMSRFVAPIMPEPEDVLRMDGAREAMDWLRAALDNCEPGGELADLSSLDEKSRDVVNQILGEGEVSIVCDGTVRSRTQESVLAGVWRTFFFDDDDRVVCDLLEVAEVPRVVGFAADSAGTVDAGAEGVVVCDLLEVAEVPRVVGFAADSAGTVDAGAEGVGPELAPYSSNSRRGTRNSKAGASRIRSTSRCCRCRSPNSSSSTSAWDAGRSTSSRALTASARSSARRRLAFGGCATTIPWVC